MLIFSLSSLQSTHDFIEIREVTNRISKANLRIGIDTSNIQTEEEGTTPLPYLCGQVYVKTRLSLEGCGNGSGFLHQRNVPDTSHFRARYSLYDQNMSNVQWNIDMGLGFVEYQIGEDQIGFSFGEAVPGQVETSGPEAMFSLSGKWWFWENSSINTDLSVGSAYVVGAPVVLQSTPLQYFGSFTVGIGF